MLLAPALLAEAPELLAEDDPELEAEAPVRLPRTAMPMTRDDTSEDTSLPSSPSPGASSPAFFCRASLAALFNSFFAPGGSASYAAFAPSGSS